MEGNIGGCRDENISKIRRQATQSPNSERYGEKEEPWNFGLSNESPSVAGCGFVVDSCLIVAWIFARYAECKFDYFTRDGRPAELHAAPAVIPPCGNQFSVPVQDGIGSDNRRRLVEPLSPEDLTFASQTPPLVIIVQDASLAELFQEHSILGRRYSMTSCC